MGGKGGDGEMGKWEGRVEMEGEEEMEKGQVQAEVAGRAGREVDGMGLDVWGAGYEKLEGTREGGKAAG